MDFSDKVVLITGASSGIGAATAINFAKLSAKLVLVSRNENNLNKIALYCEKAKGIKPFVIVADVTVDEEVQKIIKETLVHYGQLNILVNNAGIICMGGIKDTDMEKYDRVMSTNMRSVYHITMLAVPHLIITKGCIVNVSCISSTKATTSALPYHISKSALDQFTKSIALELALDGVRVNSVNPGFVKTNLLKDIGLNEDQLDLYMKNVCGNIPLKKLVGADEVAGLITFLSSDSAKSVTGSHYTIDGGSSLKN